MRAPLLPLACAAALLLSGCGADDPVSTVTVTRATQTQTRAAEITPTPGPATSGSPTPVAAPIGPATQQLAINPFTPDGAVAPGYTEGSKVGDAVSCSAEGGSPHGTSIDTHACGPAALRATACWRSPLEKDRNGAILCLPNPWETALVRHQAANIPDTTPQPPTAIPLGVELTDGSHWAYWGGSGWPTFAEGYEPRYECVSGCSKGQALGARTGSPAVDTSKPTWTMQKLDADQDTAAPVVVAKAWFVQSTIRPDAYVPSPTPTPIVVPTPSVSPTSDESPRARADEASPSPTESRSRSRWGGSRRSAEPTPTSHRTRNR